MDPNQITGILSGIVGLIKALGTRFIEFLPNRPFDLASAFQTAAGIFNTFNEWLESVFGVSFTRLLRVIGEFFVSIFGFLIELIKKVLDFLN